MWASQQNQGPDDDHREAIEGSRYALYVAMMHFRSLHPCHWKPWDLTITWFKEKCSQVPFPLAVRVEYLIRLMQRTQTEHLRRIEEAFETAIKYDGNRDAMELDLARHKALVSAFLLVWGTTADIDKVYQSIYKKDPSEWDDNDVNYWCDIVEALRRWTPENETRTVEDMAGQMEKTFPRIWSDVLAHWYHPISLCSSLSQIALDKK